MARSLGIRPNAQIKRLAAKIDWLTPPPEALKGFDHLIQLVFADIQCAEPGEEDRFRDALVALAWLNERVERWKKEQERE